MNHPVLPLAVIFGLIAAGALLWLFLSAAFLLWGARLAGIEKRSFGRAIGTILLVLVAVAVVPYLIHDAKGRT